jgi:FAD binding domain/Berberine and berberine like
MFDVDVAARSGGHSYGGYSNSDGLVIDVSQLSTIAVNTSSNIATIGAGAKLIDVYNAVGSKNLLLPAGSCPTVGIAGLAMGGGIGVFGRKFGMTCDNINAAHIVTAGGNKLRTTASEHADLLWATRGGGGGNFGVATSFDFVVHPMPDITLFSLQFPWAAASDMLEAWQQWTVGAPDELWSNCQLQSDGGYGYLAEIGGVYCGTPAALTSLLAPLKTAIGTAPSYDFVGSNEYLAAMEIEAGCSGLTIAACHLTSQTPQGTLSRSAYSAKSSYVNTVMNSNQVASIVGAIENLKAHAPTVGGALAFDSYGGVINRIGATDTAFVHRDKLACIQASYSWSSETSASEIAAGETWLQWLATNVFDPTTGAYQNYIDPTLKNWEQAYYGENLSRLERVKAKYDPANRFSFAQSIPTTT